MQVWGGVIAPRYLPPHIGDLDVMDCCYWARACQACQRSKVSRHTVTPVGDLTLPATHFLHLHLDIIGPLPHSAGNTYCLTPLHTLARSHPDRRRDHTRRATVRTTDTTAKALSTTSDLVPLLNEDRPQRCSLPCIVNCKGNVHNRHRQRHPTSLPPPHHGQNPSSKCQFLNCMGSRFYMSPRKLVPQRRSPATIAQLMAGPSSLTDNCLIASSWDYAEKNWSRITDGCLTPRQTNWSCCDFDFDLSIAVIHYQ
jgi:hypothetical protein